MKLINLFFGVILTFICFSHITAQKVNIIPYPVEVVLGEDSLEINEDFKIISSSLDKESASFLQRDIKDISGINLELLEAKNGAENTIKFIIDQNLAKEAYELQVGKSGVTISASNSTGWFYGTQSLLQLIPFSALKEKSRTSFKIPLVSIKDSPRFSWRAYMLDEARYFKGMDQVKLLLDEMAFLKMNVFHWHLTDDAGWRIEIKKYPLLTEIGSKRKSTQIGPEKWNSSIQSGEPHEGFYTQEEIKEIVEYASDRHITIVPEIEMPGHSSAAIAAYPWLGTNKDEIEVPIVFGVGTDVYDVADPIVYKFLTDVLDEVIALFPSKVIHIGGDEVKYNHWKESESVQAYMKENNLETPAGLQVFFTNRISLYLQGKGRRMMGWNEIMGHNVHDYQDAKDTESDQKLASNTVVHFWKGDIEKLTDAASNGYDIVNSLHSSTYLDYNYKSIPLKKAYSFDPIPEKLEPEFHDKVIGTGCQMWGEWIPTAGNMHFLTFPRIAAYSEVGWTRKVNKDYDHFKSSLVNLQERWTKKGIYYAPDSVTDIESKE
ncbi:UNVERIFIED_CONTAM: hypothetical protein GTU68_067293 [Idotea baltica]|nr:hypothetical protein [Idotea baltica]